MFRVFGNRFANVNRLNAALVGGALVFSVVLLFWRLIYLTNLGGGEFQHADWLINFSSGIVRRGISGEIFFWAGEVLNISPLVLVSFVQGALVLSLVGVVLFKGLHLGMSDRVLLLSLSPALVFFWVNATNGAYRKELLGVVVFLPLLFPRLNPRFANATMLSLFAIAGFFHELNVVLAPALTYALYLRRDRGDFIVTTILLWTIALAAGVFAMMYARVPDTEAMCQRLLDVGLSDHLCHGIFPWLEDGFMRTFSAVTNIVLNQVNLPLVLMIVVLLILPGVWIAWGMLTSYRERLFFLIGPGAIFALYPIATDWSRWLSIQVWVMTFLIFILAETHQGLARPVPRPLFAGLVAFNLGLGINPIAPMPLEGFVYNFFTSLGIFLS